MYFTKQQFSDHLFLANNPDNNYGFVAFVIPDFIESLPNEDQISLEEALTTGKYQGTFVFSAQGPDMSTQEKTNNFLNEIFRLIPFDTRFLIWPIDINNITPNNVYKATINIPGTILTSSLNVPIVPWSIDFYINSGMQLSINGDGSTILFDSSSQNQSQIGFSGLNRPLMKKVTQCSLPCSGNQRGCIQFTGYIQRESLQQNWRPGFQFVIPDPDNPADSDISEWLPFFNLAGSDSNSDDYIGFNISIDPTDLFNAALDPCDGQEDGTSFSMSESYKSRRTFFNFTSKDFAENSITLSSFYQTVFGETVILIPDTDDSNATYNARLVFSLSVSSTSGGFLMCPEGDFILALPNTADDYNHYLCCGLSGTEFFKITPQTTSPHQKGDILRLISRQPAYIPDFPFSAASPVGQPIDPTASPFDKTYLSSWATLVNNSENSLSYVSQPKESPFFGENSAVQPDADLLGHATPGFQVTANDTTFFPMVPYFGFSQETPNSMPSEDVQTLEKTIISPQRRSIVSSLSTTNADLITAGTVAGTQVNVTTPSGLIAMLTEGEGAVQWNSVQLGRYGSDTDEIVSFNNPSDPLINALQSSDVFLIAANNQYIGVFENGQFQNQIAMTGWEMQINVGLNQNYADYSNVMIIKGRKGKLYDPSDLANSLITNPQKWTQSQNFAVVDNDTSQLVILSQWLQTYFENARQQSGNAYFDKFNQIAVADSWTGILFLRVDITKIPENLTGILAGVTTPNAFYAHHVAIEISPVTKGDNGPDVQETSSIFGLIYYVDPDFSDISPVQSIAPTGADPSNPYNFRLLSLKVLFENTAVKSFESYAQLTLTQLFGSTVTKMGDPDNIYKNVLLAGSLQINNGTAVYSLSTLNDDSSENGNNNQNGDNSEKDNAFYLDSNIINKIDITDVTLSTRSGEGASTVVSWFGMKGFIDFYILKHVTSSDDSDDSDGSDNTELFDIFSFGSADPDQPTPKQGLSFSNLGIQMTSPEADPTQSNLTFDSSEITFDLSLSNPRQNSLYLKLVLDLDSLVEGTADKTPSDSGYLDVIADIRLGGVASGDWYGLRFKLNMGSPGELAGKVNLDSYILLSWSPTSNADSYKAGIGISLPGTGSGAKLISLQNVMKLSIGQIRLKYLSEQNSFLLLFTEIALKFLGLAKIPPNGNILFYLFSNPNTSKAKGLGWYAMYNNISSNKNKARKLKALKR